MKDIVLYGAGGMGREAASMINYSINVVRPKSYRLLGYIVDEQYGKPGTDINGYPILGDMNWLVNHRDDVVCALTIGDNTDEKERIFHMLDENRIMIETLVDGYAFVPPTCELGRGSYIGYLCSLSVNSKIGDGVFLGTHVLGGHDLEVGSFSTVYHRATISGHCKIGRHVLIGGNSYICPSKKIGDRAVVAAGSVVFSNVKEGTHVLGNPAKRITL